MENSQIPDRRTPSAMPAAPAGSKSPHGQTHNHLLISDASDLTK
jgi:hypothetical protein